MKICFIIKFEYIINFSNKLLIFINKLLDKFIIKNHEKLNTILFNRKLLLIKENYYNYF